MGMSLCLKDKINRFHYSHNKYCTPSCINITKNHLYDCNGENMCMPFSYFHDHINIIINAIEYL